MVSDVFALLVHDRNIPDSTWKAFDTAKIPSKSMSSVPCAPGSTHT
jgi:hypothetical protein